MSIMLHVHSWCSLLKGVSSPKALLERAAACGYTALALTDTNNLYGAVAFTEQARQHGIRPLLGACLRLRRSRCVALIADRTGYRSLCRVLSRLHLDDQPHPCPLAALLNDNNEGLHVLVDDLVLGERLREAFADRLWLEIVRPPRSPRHEQELLEWGLPLGLRTIASTAAHGATAAEYPIFRLITAVRQATLLDQPPQTLPITPAHHLVAPEELRQRFHDLPEAVQNTDLLAEQLRSDVLPRDTILPPPRLPHNLDGVRYLRLLCERGLRHRDLGDSLTARERLHEELAVIESADLSSYFLVVRDIACYARRRGHGMALRGSAGNSLVCFLLEITDVDPLRFGLPLERFLHPGRNDLPDIDLDFDWKVRDDVIAHVVRRWGPIHTAQISSHLFLQPRSAFREAAKLHGLSNEQVSQVLSHVQSPRFHDEEDSGRVPAGFPLEAERWPRILATARLLLGRPHHLSIHPGGVVITPRPIEEHVPLQRAAKGVVITQFEKDAIEHVGLVKIDLLGNRGLATVDEARMALGGQEKIPHGLRTRTAHTDSHGQDKKKKEAKKVEDSCLALLWSDPWRSVSVGRAAQLRGEFPPDRGEFGPDRADPAIVALLQRGDTLGIVQMESPAMRHLLVQMRPRNLADVAQSLALIRPAASQGGMKENFIRRRRGLEPVRHLHPSLAPLLQETQGVLVFADDALRAIQALTGLSATDADRFRKRIGEYTTPAEGQALGQELTALCARQGVEPKVAAAVWGPLSQFNRYGFCKSHAVSYSLIAWEAAWLKVHHPLCFWTAVLNNNQGMYPSRVYVEAIKQTGITLRLPCVNRSEITFTMEPEEGANAIRVGLGAIAGLDDSLRLALIDERQRHGPFRSLADFRRRVCPGPETLALLIRCGALDFTGQPRPALFLEADWQDRAGGDAELFPAALDWSPTDYDHDRRLRDEWALLGFVTGPPLMALFRPGLPASLITSRELADHVGRRICLAGLVATSRDTRTRDDKIMKFVTLQDEWGLVEVVIFPGTCPHVGQLSLGPYLVTGTVEVQYDVVTLTAESFHLPNSA